METWKEKALIILRDSLFPVPIELNSWIGKVASSKQIDCPTYLCLCQFARWWSTCLWR
jgi:hypothetical protein